MFELRTAVSRSTMKVRTFIILICLAYPVLASDFSISRRSSSTLYFDASTGSTGGYAAFEIKNVSGNASDVWVRIYDFSGPLLSLASGDEEFKEIGVIPVGESRSAFFYLNVSGETLTPETFTVEVYSGPVPNSPIANAVFPIQSRLSTPFEGDLGIQSEAVLKDGELVLSMEGTIAAMDIGTLNFAPVTRKGWPAASYRLKETQITLNGGEPELNTLALQSDPSTDGPIEFSAKYVFDVAETPSEELSMNSLVYFKDGLAGGESRTSIRTQIAEDTPTPEPTATPEVTPTPELTPTPEPVPTPTPVIIPSPTPIIVPTVPTFFPFPTSTPTRVPTGMPTVAPTPTRVPSGAVTPASTHTPVRVGTRSSGSSNQTGNVNFFGCSMASRSAFWLLIPILGGILWRRKKSRKSGSNPEGDHALFI
jgi:hypothetical protein